MTVAQFCDQYLETGEGRIKPSTLAMDKSRIERHVKPLLGSRPVADLTPADMEQFLRDVTSGRTAIKAPKQENGKRPRSGQTTGGSGVVSRTLGMLRTILERAARDGVPDRNPVSGVARPKDNPRKPPFSFETITALGKAMREAEMESDNVTGLRAITFLLLSGCRGDVFAQAVHGRSRCIRADHRDAKDGSSVPLSSA